jgi:membrane dipeptidase
LDDHPRNVPDDILKLVAANGGVVMVNFAPGYVSEELFHWNADEEAEKTRYSSPYAGLYIGPARCGAAAAMAEWYRKHPAPKATLAQVADHVEHIRAIAGIDHVGIGSDFDGIEDAPVGLGNVSRLPGAVGRNSRGEAGRTRTWPEPCRPQHSARDGACRSGGGGTASDGPETAGAWANLEH